MPLLITFSSLIGRWFTMYLLEASLRYLVSWAYTLFSNYRALEPASLKFG